MCIINIIISIFRNINISDGAYLGLGSPHMRCTCNVHCFQPFKYMQEICQQLKNSTDIIGVKR